MGFVVLGIVVLGIVVLRIVVLGIVNVHKFRACRKQYSKGKCCQFYTTFTYLMKSEHFCIENPSLIKLNLN